MAFTQMNILGSPNIGIYCYCNDRYCLVPYGLDEKKIRRIEECLGVKVYQTTVAGSILLGVLIAGNNNGIILPHIIYNEELKFLEEVCGKVAIANTKWTALGNMLVANDEGGLIDPRSPSKLISDISNKLEISIEKGKINGLHYVGSLAVTTSKGALTHPKIDTSEKVKLEKTFGVESEPCTVNGGVPFPKSGLLANKKGVIFGNLTTGLETAVIASALKV